MLIKAFALNSDNKIELTLSELESLLNAAYQEGVREECNKKVFKWDYPYITCDSTNIPHKDTTTLLKEYSVSDSTTNAKMPYNYTMQDNTVRNVINGAINE